MRAESNSTAALLGVREELETMQSKHEQAREEFERTLREYDQRLMENESQHRRLLEERVRTCPPPNTYSELLFVAGVILIDCLLWAYRSNG